MDQGQNDQNSNNQDNDSQNGLEHDTIDSIGHVYQGGRGGYQMNQFQDEVYGQDMDNRAQLHQQRPQRTMQNYGNLNYDDMVSQGNQGYQYKQEYGNDAFYGQNIGNEYGAMDLNDSPDGKFPVPKTLNMDSGMVGGSDIKDMKMINPLLYKPASKPPIIREGDWLCPDTMVSKLLILVL